VEKTYQPIACRLHDEYELAVLRRAALDLSWRSEAGEACSDRLVPEDVFTRQGAEFLAGRTTDGILHEIRLDRIISAHRVATGEPLGSLSEN